MQPAAITCPPRAEKRALLREAALWIALLMGPAVWLAGFGTEQSLAVRACTAAWGPAVYVLSGGALLLVAGTGVLDWVLWIRLGDVFATRNQGAAARDRILAIGGVLLNAVSFLMILAQALWITLVERC